MSLGIWLVALFLALLLNGGSSQSNRPQYSDNHVRDLADELDETLQVVIGSLLNTFSGLLSGQDPANTTSLHTLYKAFSKKFSRNMTKIGYCHFVESLYMISAHYHEASMQPAAVNQPPSQNIPTLVQNFNAAYGTRNSIELCDFFGKMLNLKDHRRGNQDTQRENIQRRDSDQYECPEENCECPNGGINSTELLCSCQFFACLDEGRNLMPVFEGFAGLECLAFVLDTTGSMKDEIDTARQVIKDFIASEELGCYILVPFNDDGNDKSSVGPVTLTFVDDSDPNSIQSLQALIGSLESAFQRKSGGDCPEYCYNGILEALHTEDYGYPVMVAGSQLMVITDAPSKGLPRASDIIRHANEAQVCIHFFLGETSYNCFEDIPGSIEEYETIANATGGTVVKSKLDFSTFVHHYRSSPCGFLQPSSDRRKRSVDQVCHSVNVASLVCLLSLSVQTDEDVVTLTKPDGKQVRIRTKSYQDTAERIAVYSESHPMSGNWTVCASTPIQVAADFQMCIDIAPFYIVNTTEGSQLLTAATVPGCTLAHIVLISTRCAEVSCPVLYMLDREGSVVSESSLEICGNSMSANIKMPIPGSYYYKLGGQDTAGNTFNHLIQRKITVLPGCDFYSLTRVGREMVTVLSGQVAILRFKFTSTNPYGSVPFSFTLAEQGLQHLISPSEAEMTYGQSVNVTVHVRPLNSQTVTLVVFNECYKLTAKRTITIVLPVTTAPPPDECSPPCLNGGTCAAIRRRRREFHVCRCAPNYYGRGCENLRN